MSQRVIEAIEERFGQYVLGTHSQAGDDTAIIAREGLVPIVTFLRDDPAMHFEMCVDITGVDKLGFPEHDGPRFEVVYHFLSLKHRHRVRLKVPLAEDDLEVDSITSLYKGANWFEREVWDMFGVRFRNSPDHRRILLYEEFEGHPLRKDYPQRAYQALLPMPSLPRHDEPLPPLLGPDAERDPDP